MCQYIGEICRYLLNQPPRPDDRAHTLRAMTGAGLSADVWERFQARFGVAQIFEGWGSTEANTNLMNLDNRIGSCGRIPYFERSNLRLARYDIESGTHPRDAAGLVVSGAGRVPLPVTRWAASSVSSTVSPLRTAARAG